MLEPKLLLRIANGVGLKLRGENRRIEMYEGSLVFRSLFGVSPEVACQIYNTAKFKEAKLTPKHLLWALAHANLYMTESAMPAMVETTRKTFRKYTFRALARIGSIYNDLVRILNDSHSYTALLSHPRSTGVDQVVQPL